MARDGLSAGDFMVDRGKNRPGGLSEKSRARFLRLVLLVGAGVEPLLCVGLIIGLWANGKAIVSRWAEATLAMLVVMYSWDSS